MSGTMFYVPRRSQLPAFVPTVISSLFPTTNSNNGSNGNNNINTPPPSSSASPTTSHPSLAHNPSSSISHNGRSALSSAHFPHLKDTHRSKQSTPSTTSRTSTDSTIRHPDSVVSSCNNSRFPPALCFPQIKPTPELKAWKSQSGPAARTLQNLLRATHSIFALIQPCPQTGGFSAANLTENLCTAYLLGASASHLRTIFDHSTGRLNHWSDSPTEIAPDDWQEHLGDVNYQRAYLDFFEDQLVEYGYDWRSVVLDYMFRVDQPLITGITGSWGAALIRLGLAYELDSSILAMEALAIGACMYTKQDGHHAAFHSNFSPLDTWPEAGVAREPFSSPDVQTVLEAVAADKRLSGKTTLGSGNYEQFCSQYTGVFEDFQDSWDLSRDSSRLAVERRFEKGHKVVAAALVNSIKCGDEAGSYSMALASAVMLSHAIRVMIPAIPTVWQVGLVCSWWKVVLAAYISAGCPAVADQLELSAEERAFPTDWGVVRRAFGSTVGDEGAGATGDVEASDLVATVVASSAEAGGRRINEDDAQAGKTNGVDYQALMKEMYTARRLREDRQEESARVDESGEGAWASGQDGGLGAPSEAEIEGASEPAKAASLWTEGPLVAAIWSLQAAASEAQAIHDRDGMKLFEVLARRAVGRLGGAVNEPKSTGC